MFHFLSIFHLLVIVSIHDFLAVSVYFGRHFIERRALLSLYLHISQYGVMDSYFIH